MYLGKNCRKALIPCNDFQVRALDSFYKTLTNDPLKAFYGEKHVFRASEAQAIEVLLISDKLFRARVRRTG